MAWKKLILRNNWGHQYYSFVPTSEAMNDVKTQAVVSNIGKKVSVRWPKHPITEELVCSKTIYDVNEHIPSLIPVIKVNYYGIELEVDLDRVEVWESEWPLFWDKKE